MPKIIIDRTLVKQKGGVASGEIGTKWHANKANRKRRSVYILCRISWPFNQVHINSVCVPFKKVISLIHVPQPICLFEAGRVLSSHVLFLENKSKRHEADGIWNMGIFIILQNFFTMINALGWLTTGKIIPPLPSYIPHVTHVPTSIHLLHAIPTNRNFSNYQKVQTQLLHLYSFSPSFCWYGSGWWGYVCMHAMWIYKYMCERHFIKRWLFATIPFVVSSI